MKTFLSVFKLNKNNLWNIHITYGNFFLEQTNVLPESRYEELENMKEMLRSFNEENKN